MKNSLFITTLLLFPSAAFSQIIQSSAFFNPDFSARRPGATSGLINLVVNNTTYSQSSSSGNVSWTHNAGGFVQSRVNVTAPITNIVLANLDAQLAAKTSTVGDSLVFGREITKSATLAGLNVTGFADQLDTLANGLAGASVLYNWSSTSTVSNLLILPDQVYSVKFNVASGSGLPVNLLSSSTFGITTAGVTGTSGQSAQLLSLLGVLNIGAGASTGEYEFLFKSANPLTSLDFAFAATTGVGVTGLGGVAGDQTVLTFSGLNVTPVPEPRTLALAGAFGMMSLLRRRR